MRVASQRKREGGSINFANRNSKGKRNKAKEKIR
jgi:hypothetical protein